MRPTRTICLILAISLLCGCGGDDDDTGPTEPDNNQIYDSLIFTRPTGGGVKMGDDWAICCGTWEAGYIEENTLKVLIYDTFGQESGFKLFLLVDSVEANVAYGLPTAEPGVAPVSLVSNDMVSQNELNSAAAGSFGTIRVNSFNCGPPVTLDVTIDATLASEFFGSPPVTVSGRFICEIHTNPATFGCEFGL